MSLSVSIGIDVASRESVPQTISTQSLKPSLSSSKSQTSPKPSPSVSNWSGLAVKGQLSNASKIPSLSSSVSALSPIPSPSASPLSEASKGKASSESATPSLSSSGSQASPIPSPSVSNWLALAVFIQLSHTSPTPSPSASAWSLLAVLGQLSFTPVIPSLSGSFWLSAHPFASIDSPFGVLAHWSNRSVIPSPSESAFRLTVLFDWVEEAVAPCTSKIAFAIGATVITSLPLGVPVSERPSWTVDPFTVILDGVVEERVTLPPVRDKLKSSAASVVVAWEVPPKTDSEKITETVELSEAIEVELITGSSFTSLTLTVSALAKVFVPSLAWT